MAIRSIGPLRGPVLFGLRRCKADILVRQKVLLCHVAGIFHGFFGFAGKNARATIVR